MAGLNLIPFIVILSTAIGAINLFPILPLDGGHLGLYICEGLRGRPLSQKVQNFLSLGGASLFFVFFLFVFYNDIFGCR